TYALSLDGRIIAGALGLAHRGSSFLVILGGFDFENFKNQSVGSLMFEQVARDCIERGEKVLDFTIGDEPYKLTFGATPAAMWKMSLPGSPMGYAAELVTERMPAVKSLARRLFQRPGEASGQTAVLSAAPDEAASG